MTSTPQNPYRGLDDAQYAAIVDGEYRKSSYSGGNGGCLSLTRVGDHIGLQDDKLAEPLRRQLTHVYTRDEIAAFLRAAKEGEFDHLIA